MLGRASGGRARASLSRALLAQYEQLQLPWLCPAVSTPALAQKRKHSTNVSSPRDKCISPQFNYRAGGARSRRIGTAADSASQLAEEDATPFREFPGQRETSDHNAAFYHRIEEKAVSFKPIRRDDLVILPEHDPDAFTTGWGSGVPGDLALLYENFKACLRVGALKRASDLLRGLNRDLAATTPELVDSHHEYLRALLEIQLREPIKERFIEMQKWIELDMRAAQIPLDGRIIAIILKACFMTLRGSKRDRRIRRYLEYADQYGINTKTDAIASLLFTDSEHHLLVAMLPEEYEKPEEYIAENEIENFAKSHQLDNLARNDAEYMSVASTPENLPVPLKETELRGQGLKALKRSLVSMSSKEHKSAQPEESEEQRQYRRQVQLEEDVMESALQRWRENISEANEAQTQGTILDSELGTFALKWVSQMQEMLRQQIEKADNASNDRMTIENLDMSLITPLLKTLDPEKACTAAVLTLISSVFNYSSSKDTNLPHLPVVRLIRTLGNAVLKEARYNSVPDEVRRKLNSLPSAERRKRLVKLLRNQSLLQNESLSTSKAGDTPTRTNEDIATSTSDPLEISNLTKLKLGAFFATILLKAVQLPVMSRAKSGKLLISYEPAIKHDYHWKKGKKWGVIKANANLIWRMKREPMAAFITKEMPMIIEPRPWEGLQDGAFLKTKASAVRFTDKSLSQKQYLEIADKRGDLKQIYRGLDVIGKVAWRINKPVFQVMTDVWNTGEAVGNFAPENPALDYPAAPPKDDKVAYYRWRRICKDIDNNVTGFHSQRCYQNFQLEIARALLNETFYNPHSVDFRGRAYPIPPYFNHMGADYVRGLFLFARGRPLGKVGISWLKVHLANMYGFDKESLKDRENFANDHIDDIYDSALRPMVGRRWWLTAENPWQCLAACMELRNALDSPIPAEYVSHIPVQQDGSCNGLQHYAALGGDEIGAEQVNLTPGDKPADIYSAVASLVKRDVEADAERGSKIALTLRGNISRKVVKQPVMTNVYGVTFIGAAAQVRKQLLDIFPSTSLDADNHHGLLSQYVAKLIFKALAEMFNGAHAIQSWLGECGSRISKAVTPEQVERIKRQHIDQDARKPSVQSQLVRSVEEATNHDDYQFKSTIVWTTPLGLPVVQPYRELKSKALYTSLQTVTVPLPTNSDPVSRRKQLQAFPPNFIHSLDATHMMLSALKCDEVNLTFSAVHDSFWTHACDVPVMNRILRDAFVRMHSEDVIGRLREEFVARYRGCFHWAPIDMSTPLGKKIVALLRKKGKSKTSFLRSSIHYKEQVDTLIEEYDRLRLLASEDPEEQRQGREMETPGALCEAAGFRVELDNLDEVALLGRNNTAEQRAMLDAHGLPEGRVESAILEPATEDAPGDELSSGSETGMESENKDGKDTNNEGTPATSRQKSGGQLNQRLYFWMPLTFPEAPKKGTFDVSRLRQSQYFFS